MVGSQLKRTAHSSCLLCGDCAGCQLVYKFSGFCGKCLVAPFKMLYDKRKRMFVNFRRFQSFFELN